MQRFCENPTCPLYLVKVADDFPFLNFPGPLEDTRLYALEPGPITFSLDEGKRVLRRPYFNGIKRVYLCQFCAGVIGLMPNSTVGGYEKASLESDYDRKVLAAIKRESDRILTETRVMIVELTKASDTIAKAMVEKEGEDVQ